MGLRFTIEQIKRELAAAEQSQAPAAAYYLRKELNRRKASQTNPGRPRKYNDEQHQKDRERKRAMRIGVSYSGDVRYEPIG